MADPERCPECGAVIDEAHREAARRRERLADGSARELILHAIAWLAVIATYGVGAGIVDRSAATAASAAVAMGLAVALSGGAGIIVSRLAPQAHRTVLAIAWARSLWWMHGPWLVVGPCAALLFLTAALDRLFGTGAASTVMAGMLGFALWALACFGFLVQSFVVLLGVDERYALAASGQHRRLVVLVILGHLIVGTLAGGAILGFAGGSLAVSNAMTLAAPEWMDGWED